MAQCPSRAPPLPPPSLVGVPRCRGGVTAGPCPSCSLMPPYSFPSPPFASCSLAFPSPSRHLPLTPPVAARRASFPLIFLIFPSLHFSFSPSPAPSLCHFVLTRTLSPSALIPPVAPSRKHFLRAGGAVAFAAAVSRHPPPVSPPPWKARWHPQRRETVVIQISRHRFQTRCDLCWPWSSPSLAGASRLGPS